MSDRSSYEGLRLSSIVQLLKSRKLTGQQAKLLLTTLKGKSSEELEALFWTWEFWARDNQLPPPGDWKTWLILAGRGFGKTRTGAQWVHERAMEWPGRWIALIAKTPADARDYMLEGPGGLLKHAPPWERPTYIASKRRVTWPNGSWATVYSDEAPDQTRGFSGDTAWLDEFAKWRNPQECWDNLQFGMRESSNDRPRQLITTTPRPIKLLTIIKNARTTVVGGGTSYENRENLDPTWFKDTILDYANTRLGRQEVNAEILEDFPGALWNRKLLDDNRVPGWDSRVQSKKEWRDSWKDRMKRIGIAMDPAGSSSENAAEHGVIIGGVDDNDHGYVLEDISKLGTPADVAKRIVQAYDDWSADIVVGEVNNGGEWIGTTIRAVAKLLWKDSLRRDGTINYRAVRATRGKYTRAEPISSLDEQHQIHHVGLFPELEDQLCTWDPMAGMKSPDRLDARVWLFTELMVGTGKGRAGVLF